MSGKYKRGEDVHLYDSGNLFFFIIIIIIDYDHDDYAIDPTTLNWEDDPRDSEEEQPVTPFYFVNLHSPDHEWALDLKRSKLEEPKRQEPFVR